jgi:hypothetical protein
MGIKVMVLIINLRQIEGVVCKMMKVSPHKSVLSLGSRIASELVHVESQPPLVRMTCGKASPGLQRLHSHNMVQIKLPAYRRHFDDVLRTLAVFSDAAEYILD